MIFNLSAACAAGKDAGGVKEVGHDLSAACAAGKG